MDLTIAEINHRTGAVIDAAMKVHTILGPGLLESAYTHCLAFEVRKRGFEVITQYPIPLLYEGTQLEAVYKADLLIDRAVIFHSLHLKDGIRRRVNEL